MYNCRYFILVYVDAFRMYKNGCPPVTSNSTLIKQNLSFWIEGSRDKLSLRLPVKILGNSLQPAESVKYLGVWFNSDFYLSLKAFTEHMEGLLSPA